MRSWRNTEGAFAIEYAIALPVLLLIILGVVQFALIMFAQASLDEAISEAAREGSTQYAGYATGQWGTYPSQCQPACQNTALAVAQAHMNGVPGYETRIFSINQNYLQTPGGPGDTVTYCMDWALPEIPFLSNFIGPGYTDAHTPTISGYYQILSCDVVQNENCSTLPCVTQ